MNHITERVLERREAIRRRCLARLLEAFPSEVAAHLRNEKDRFQNPVGYALEAAIDGLFDCLSDTGEQNDAARRCVNDLVRILAVQGRPPSEALSFIHFFKEAIRVEVAQAVAKAGPGDEIFLLEARLDEVTMDAFDYYMELRERVGSVRVGEARAASERLSRLLAAMMRGGGAAEAMDNPIGEEAGR